jgi:hypothetical protein
MTREWSWSTRTPAPQGVKTRRDVLLDYEVEVHDCFRLTTAVRTAFDIGRRDKLDTAIARLDALTRATNLKLADVEALATRHHGAPGLRQLEHVLELVDAGAQSPRETALRLMIIRDGLPKPPDTNTRLCRRRHTDRVPRYGVASVDAGDRVRR